MRCTIGSCQSPLQYKGGENLEDYGCPNRSCRRFEIHYYGNVKVRQNWYYAAGYSMPFEYVDVHHRRPDHHYHWYALVGTPDGQTELQGLRLADRVGVPSWNERLQDYSATTYQECRQEPLFTIPYVALPTNADF